MENIKDLRTIGIVEKKTSPYKKEDVTLTSFKVKGLSLLKTLALDWYQKELINVGFLNLKRYAHIIGAITGHDVEQRIVYACVKQGQTDKALSINELKDRVMSIFESVLPAGYRVGIKAVPYMSDTIKDLNLDYFLQLQRQHELKNVEIANMIGSTESTISQMLSGDKKLTNWHKAALFYMFKSLE